MKLAHKIVQSNWAKEIRLFEAFIVNNIEIQNIKVTFGKNIWYVIQRTIKQNNSHPTGHLMTLFLKCFQIYIT